ncbi:MAG: ATP-binding cassette domain-containing protein [Actinomycetales bacterium]|nr:ATP-binding cassette domain-containing protein [Actinomycetales bacterium]
MEIELTGLTRTYGRVHAVRDLSARVVPGQVTAFLGPNGAGKTTALRMLLGLVRPDRGRALFDGRPYRDLPEPRRTVGAVLSPDGFHRGRTGRNQLRTIALAASLPSRRVDEVLDLVELTDAADRRVGGYSLGMRQRLGLACALLGDPPVLVADEPANGLDPEGIAWLRDLLRRVAGQGRTVLVSSHLLAEVARTADRVLVIAHGRLRFDGPLTDLAGGTTDADALETAFLQLTSGAAA